MFLDRFEVRSWISWTGEGFRWEDRDGNWIDYDEEGVLLAYGEKNGITVTMAYDGNGNRTGVFDHHGRQVVWYEYNADGEVTAARDLTGRRAEYTWQGGLLTKATNVLGDLWRYEYKTGSIVEASTARAYGAADWPSESAGSGSSSSGAVVRISDRPEAEITVVTDPEGRVTEIGYFPSRQVAKVIYPDDSSMEYTYSYNESRVNAYVKRSSSSGREVETWHNQEGILTRIDIDGQTRLQRSVDGLTRTATDATGHTTVRRYDEFENLLEVDYADGSTMSYEYDLNYSTVLSEINEIGVETKRMADANGNVVRVVEAAGEGAERTIDIERDTHGQITRVTRVADADTAEASLALEYDDAGNVVRRVDAAGNAVSMIYDDAGNLRTWTNELGQSWTFSYDLMDRITAIENPLGHTTSAEYDRVGNVTRIEGPRGNAVSFAYDQRDNLIRTVNADGSEALYAYNEHKEIIGLSDESDQSVDIERDLMGRITRIEDGEGRLTEYNYIGASNLVSRIDYPAFSLDVTYDNRNHRASIVANLPEGRTISVNEIYDAAGRMTQRVDPMGRTAKLRYDALGRLIEHENPLGGIVQYRYDDGGNLIRLTDANNHTYTFNYDALDRLVREERPMGDASTYEYDAASRLTKKTAPKGNWTRFDYDAAGRQIIQQLFDNSGAQEKRVDFAYDAAGNLVAYDDGTISADYEYDNRHRLITETVDYGATVLGHAYTYYANDQKASYTAPDGATYAFDYHDDGNLASFALPGQGTITYPTYEWLQPSQTVFPGGTARQVDYDGLLRPQSIQVQDPAGDALMAFDYQYDSASNVTRRQTDNGIEAYAYDGLDRLVEADLPIGVEQYSYDPAGNRITSADAGNWEYDANNRLLHFNGTEYEYDLNGNRIEKRVDGQLAHEYVYNANDRLERVTGPGGEEIARYYYDPFGHRRMKTVDGQTTLYHYADEGMVGEFDVGGNAIRTYGYAPDSIWNTNPVFQMRGGEYYFYQNDHLGTPHRMSAESGELVWSAQYEAFGNVVLDDSVVDEDPPEDRPAELTAPAPGAIIDHRVVTFQWDGGVGVERYRLLVGTEEGTWNLASPYPNGTSYVVDVPLTGEPVHVKLRSLIDGTWQDRDYAFQTATDGTDTAAQLTSPAPGATIDTRVATFQWTPGVNVERYRLLVGTADGTWDLASPYPSGTSYVVDVPLSGEPLHVKLRSLIGGVWVDRDYTYATATDGTDSAARLTNPAPGATIDTQVVTFQWEPGTNVERYRLLVGTEEGTWNLASPYPDGTSYVVDLPLSGEPIHVKLRSLIQGVWIDRDYAYDTATVGSDTAAQLTSPAPGATIGTRVVEFTWDPGENVERYRLLVGTEHGNWNLASPYPHGTSYVVDVPLSGEPVHVKLRSLIGGVWVDRDYIYQSATDGSDTAANLTKPIPGSTIDTRVVHFQWSPGSDVERYRLLVGTEEGTWNLASPYPNGTSYVVDVPLSGEPIYVKLRSLIGGVWIDRDYIYQSATDGGDTAANLLNPAPGSTIDARVVHFEWSPGSDVERYRLLVGTDEGNWNLASPYPNGTSYVVDVPLSGEPVHVKLRSLIGGVWVDRDYVYQSASDGGDSAANLTNPAPGTTIDTRVVHFEWSPGLDVERYRLLVGTEEGTWDLASPYPNDTSYVVDVPLTGEPVYVRLRSLIGGVWIDRDYVYQTATDGADTAAQMTRPTPGATIASSPVLFEWQPGEDVERYRLLVGTADGSWDLASPYPAGTTYEVELPLNGESVFVELRSLIDGVWIDRPYMFPTSTQ